MQDEHAASSDEEQLQKLRDLLLGEDKQVVKQVLREDAREIVSEVFSEALHDRQTKDGSVDKVMMPLVEKSVEVSVETHSDQFVDYLYPLVGSLVRKSVTAFIGDLLEKTNQLLENSLTIKGLKWRIAAKRAGVSFSKYVATQTFSFQVEQVLLIHRETGLLLNSVSSGLGASADADMVSSMLTAINDFVGDSFNTEKGSHQQNLDVVKTDDFTLLIKAGPQAFIVAAVVGNMPQHVANQLQLSNEDIHKMYGKELREFDGDAIPLANSEQQLRECLISELKEEASTGKKKKPWMALVVVLGLVIGISYYSYQRWQTEVLSSQLMTMNQQAGIVVTNLEVLGLNRVEMRILRDPSAQSVEQWLDERNIPKEHVNVIENSYISLENSLLKERLMAIIQEHPSLQLSWEETTPVITGNLKNVEKLRLQKQIDKLIGLSSPETLLSQVQITELNLAADNDPVIVRAILDLNVVKIDSVELEFGPSQSQLSDDAVEKLYLLAEDFKIIIDMAEQQNLAIGLIIMGASDASGSKSFNQALSQKRANAVKLKLQEFGIDSNRLNAIGLGAIELKVAGAGARKVLFNVVYFDGN